ncbi:MAG: YciI family protein [Frankiales bacterium]|nr:YciI family protein [Frankiales bacterium]
MTVPVSPHLVLEYDLAPDYLERRGALREEHLSLVASRDDLVLAGALDSAERALLVFHGSDAARVRAFAEADPYVQQGLVTSWRVLPWNVVAGSAR